jgi:hypothetical protein
MSPGSSCTPTSLTLARSAMLLGASHHVAEDLAQTVVENVRHVTRPGKRVYHHLAG